MTRSSEVGQAYRAAAALCLAALLAAIGGCQSPVEPKENVVEQVGIENCSPETLSNVGVLDVAVAIDNSFSTGNPSGVDLDRDGVIGVVVESRFTDRDDSRLKAEIAAVRQLVVLAGLADIQFSIISYSGPSTVPTRQQPVRLVWNRDARLHSALTRDLQSLTSALDEIEQDGSWGTSNFVAGLRRATRSLVDGVDDERKSRKLILFISDSSAPVMREADRQDTMKDVRLERVARQALEAQIAINTFGLSEESDQWRLEPVGRIAGATGGDYHVVKDPRTLFCHLAGSLVSASASQ